MEQYPIPQFIEQEAKIAFFISFRQFFYLVGAGVVCFILYFVLPSFLFFIAAFLVFGGTAILAFGTIGGFPILNVIMGAIGFSMGGKNYTWKKKESPYPFKPIVRTQIKKITQGPVLQAQASQLKRMHTKLETRAK
ncbi:MAG: PrgI family protein, partial [Candidatus Staskawiczbacteria bacterium]|nr:PrgI family protein [Candidatus Staskawiczbacteria bacterium]